jgi:hypothetical protein
MEISGKVALLARDKPERYKEISGNSELRLERKAQRNDG